MDEAPFVILAPQFLADPSAGPAFFYDYDDVAAGDLSVSEQGDALTLTLDANYFGAQTVNVTLWDGSNPESLSTTTFTVDISSVDDATQANDDVLEFDYTEISEQLENGGIEIDAQALFANDFDLDSAIGDMRLAQIVSGPSHGSLSVSADGQTWTYTPNDSFSGTDQIVYTTIDTNAGPTALQSNNVTLDLSVYGVPEEPTDDAPLIAINIGSDEEYISSDGTVFAADDVSNSRSFQTSKGISGTNDDALYKTEAWSRKGLEYDFILENGVYEVELYFAEVWKGAYKDGGRVFDIALEDTLVCPGLDIFSLVGSNAALTKSYIVEVIDGNLDIDLIKGVQNPKLSALTVTRLDEQEPTVPIEQNDVPTLTYTDEFLM